MTDKESQKQQNDAQRWFAEHPHEEIPAWLGRVSLQYFPHTPHRWGSARVTPTPSMRMPAVFPPHPQIIYIAKVVSYDSAHTLGVFRRRSAAVDRCREWLHDTIKEYVEHRDYWDLDDPFPNGQIEYYSKVLEAVDRQMYFRDGAIDTPVIEEYELE